MSRHNLQAELETADMTQPGKACWIPAANKHLWSWGSGAPSGTPDSVFYIRTDATTPQTSLYDGSTGTWVAKDDFGAAGINADVIAESTSGAGVTVDGFLIKDGAFRFGASGISTIAAAGSDQSGATPITTGVTHVSGADGSKGVALPSAAAGLAYFVYNIAASPLKVYPALNDDINDGSANAAITMPGKSAGFFVAVDAATWAYRGINMGAALTAQLTTITHTTPTPDYAIQNLTQTSPYGFADINEGNTVLSVIANLQVRVAEIEARLEALGLIIAN